MLKLPKHLPTGYFTERVKFLDESKGIVTVCTLPSTLGRDDKARGSKKPLSCTTVSGSTVRNNESHFRGLAKMVIIIEKNG